MPFWKMQLNLCNDLLICPFAVVIASFSQHVGEQFAVSL